MFFIRDKKVKPLHVSVVPPVDPVKRVAIPAAIRIPTPYFITARLYVYVNPHLSYVLAIVCQ
jgi:hypothetical protein